MLIAVLLTVIPVPDAIVHYWPDWITLVVFYWVLVLPAHFGVMFGWLNGLIEDIVTFSLLGQHALGKALVGTVAAIAWQRFRLFSILEKIFLVMVVQAVSIGISVWTSHLAHSTPVEGRMWLPALTTALVWPLFALVVDRFDPQLKRRK